VSVQGVLGHLQELCRSQEGSRFIQDKIGEAEPAEVARKSAVLSAIFFVKLIAHHCFKFELIAQQWDMAACTNVKSFAQVDAAFQEVCCDKASTQELMQDVFGNYVIQKFLEHGSPGNRRSLAGMMQYDVLLLSTHTYGCRVVQKALEVGIFLHVLWDFVQSGRML
jgi:hypothetical protein